MNAVTKVNGIHFNEERKPLRLSSFFLVMFAVAWLGILPMFFASWFGAAALPAVAKPLQLLMLWGPGVVALWATWHDGNRQALIQLGQGLSRWRVDWRWYAAVLLGPALIFGISLWISYAIGSTQQSFYSVGTTLQLFANTFITYLLLNTEELAWRGYALPRLQVRWGALRASLVLWGLGMLFHAPLFLLRGGHPAGYPFPVWALLFLGLSLLFTWTFNGTRGSILLVHLLHQSINAWSEAMPLFPVVTQSLVPIGIAIGLLALVVGLYIWVVGINE